MFERFTERARQVVVRAQEQARRLEHNYIGTEHLLLGLINVPDGVAAQALTALGLSRESIAAEVDAILGSGAGGGGAHLPFTPRAKQVLELSLREAVRMGHRHIGTEHILLGLVREGEGVAAQILLKRGLALEQVRAKVLSLISAEATGTEGARGPSIGAVEDFLAPTCPTCRAAIQETGAYKDLQVHEDGGDGRILLRVVFCEACGTTLQSRIIDNP